MNDKIYVIGGYGNDKVNIKKVQIYDPTNDSWANGTDMQYPRSGLGTVVLGGKIYAIGGQDPSLSTKDVEIFDPNTNTWSDGPAMPARRTSMAVAVRGGKIYVIGGYADQQLKVAQNTMFVFDPGTNSWSTGDPMPTARYSCRAAVAGDTIYVIGGVGGLDAGKKNEAFGLFPPPTFLPQIRK